MTTKPRRKDGGLACGATAFVLVEALNGDRIFDWTAVAKCLQCGHPMTLRRGDAAAVLKVGIEIVGVACDDCLTDESFARLEALRGGKAVSR